MSGERTAISGRRLQAFTDMVDRRASCQFWITIPSCSTRALSATILPLWSPKQSERRAASAVIVKEKAYPVQNNLAEMFHYEAPSTVAGGAQAAAHDARHRPGKC